MLEIKNIANGVDSVFIKSDRFNTTLISVNFYLPLKKENIAKFALLPYILTSASEKYPDFSALNMATSSLYKTVIGGSAEKVGDTQLIRFYCSCLNDELLGEEITKKALDLLLELIFNQLVKDGAFLEKEIAREKRLTAEKIKSLINDKRSYTINRLIENMYKDEAYGVLKTGELSSVLALNGKELYAAYKKMLSSAYVKVQVVSKKMPEGLLDKFSSAFSKINRSETKINPSVAKKHEKVNEYYETAKINQAKLALGLTRKSTDDKLVHLVLSDIFGGGPYSKLFSNVREKLSLCYYCACRSYRNKGLLMVDSGVEKANLEKAKASILKEFEDIKNGNFSEELVETSKTSIIDTLLSTEDFETAVDSFYAVRTNNHLKSIKDAIKEIEAVTKEDIINAANEYTLDTVFTLLPEGQDEANN